MKQAILIILLVSLAGCGGVHKARKEARLGTPPPPPVVVSTPTNPVSTGQSTVPAAVTPAAAPTPAPMPFARGPIQSACMASDRKARSRELCGCIQAVADQTLSGAQQRVAVSFYDDPHKAQEIRQSDKRAHEEFWQDYKTYGERAEQICR